MPRSRPTLPPLSALRTFDAAVRLGTFKAAAENLGLTQSAISHQINTLETYFRRKLFARQGNRLVLTEDGDRYGRSITKAFAEISDAGEILLNKGHRDIVRVSASPSIAAFAALPYIDKFKAVSGNLDLRLEARNTRVDFDAESIDAAIQLCSPPYRGLTTHRLFKSEYAPLVHPDLLKAFGPVRAPKDLLRMPLIELNIVPGLWERWFSKCDRKIAMPRLDLSSDSLLASIQLAEARVGAILAPFPLAASLVTSGRLTAPFKPVKLIDDPDFHLVYRKSEAGTAKIKAVRKWFKDIMEEFEHFPGRGDL